MKASPSSPDAPLSAQETTALMQWLFDTHGVHATGLEVMHTGRSQLTLKCGSVYVKIYEPTPDAHSRALQVGRILEHLNTAGVCVPPLRTARSGQAVSEWDGRPVIVTTGLPGRHITTPISPAQARNAGQQIAVLHHHLKTFVPHDVRLRQPLQWNELRETWQRLTSTCSALPEREPFEAAARQIAALVSAAAPPDVDWDAQPWQLVHKDLHLNNVLFDQQHLSGILDFDVTSWGWLGMDLMTAWHYLACGEAGPPHLGPAARAFLSSYLRHADVNRTVVEDWPNLYLMAHLNTTVHLEIANGLRPGRFKLHWTTLLEDKLTTIRWLLSCQQDWQRLVRLLE